MSRFAGGRGRRGLDGDRARTSNTRRSPLFGSLPERIAVMTPSIPGNFDFSEDFETSSTTRPRILQLERLCV